MIKAIRRFAEICAETLPIRDPVYEFGALQVPGQEGFADLRSLFSGRTFIGTDYRPGPGVDRIVDLHDIDLPDASVGAALLLETIEHVEYPRRALENIRRILKPDGILLLSTVLNFPIHHYPHDYWRFTPEGIRSLLKPFAFAHVDAIGPADFPRSIVAIASPTPIPETAMSRFVQVFTRNKERWKRIDENIKQGKVKIDHI